MARVRGFQVLGWGSLMLWVETFLRRGRGKQNRVEDLLCLAQRPRVGVGQAQGSSRKNKG